VIWIIVAAAVLILLGLYLSWTAGRLDRMHARVDTSRAVLDAELLRRSSVVLDVAAGGLLDPASSVLLADAASRTRAESSDIRYEAESDLTSVLAALFADRGELAETRRDPALGMAVDELAAVCRRAGHARRMHNEIVRGAQRLRRKRFVRWFRLAGHAPYPETAEFDDTIPPALAA
jgi:hypothetical protein